MRTKCIFPANDKPCRKEECLNAHSTVCCFSCSSVEHNGYCDLACDFAKEKLAAFAEKRKQEERQRRTSGNRTTGGADGIKKSRR